MSIVGDIDRLIDLNIKPIKAFEFEYMADTGSYIAYFDDNTTPDNIHLASFEVVNSNGDHRWINLKIVDGQTTDHIVVDNTIRYFNVHNGIDVKYVVEEARLKEYIYIDSLANYKPISFSIKSDGCTWVKDPEGNILFHDIDTEEQLWIIEKPFIVDQESSMSVVAEEGDKYELFTISIDNPEEAIYPLVIDPTVRTMTSLQDVNMIYSEEFGNYIYMTRAWAWASFSYMGTVDFAYSSNDGASWGYTSTMQAHSHLYTQEAPFFFKFQGKVHAHIGKDPRNTSYQSGYIFRQESERGFSSITLPTSFVTNYYNDNNETMYLLSKASGNTQIFESTDCITWTQVFETSSFKAPTHMYKDNEGYLCVTSDTESIRVTSSTTYEPITSMPHIGYNTRSRDSLFKVGSDLIGFNNEIIYKNGKPFAIASAKVLNMAISDDKTKLYFVIYFGSGNIAPIGVYDIATQKYVEATMNLGYQASYFVDSYTQKGYGSMIIRDGKIHLTATNSQYAYYDSVADPFDGMIFGASDLTLTESSIIDPTFSDTFDNISNIQSSVNTNLFGNMYMLKCNRGPEVTIMGGSSLGGSNSSSRTYLDSNTTSYHSYNYDHTNPPYYITFIQGHFYNAVTKERNISVNGTVWHSLGSSYAANTTWTGTVNKVVDWEPDSLIRVDFGNTLRWTTSTKYAGTMRGYNSFTGSASASEAIFKPVAIPQGKGMVGISYESFKLTGALKVTIQFDESGDWYEFDEGTTWMNIPGGSTTVSLKLSMDAGPSSQYAALTSVHIAFLDSKGTPGSSSLTSTENIQLGGTTSLPMSERTLGEDAVALELIENVPHTPGSLSMDISETIIGTGLIKLPIKERITEVGASTLDLIENVSLTPGHSLLEAKEKIIGLGSNSLPMNIRVTNKDTREININETLFEANVIGTTLKGSGLASKRYLTLDGSTKFYGVLMDIKDATGSSQSDMVLNGTNVKIETFGVNETVFIRDVTDIYYKDGEPLNNPSFDVLIRDRLTLRVVGRTNFSVSKYGTNSQINMAILTPTECPNGLRIDIIENTDYVRGMVNYFTNLRRTDEVAPSYHTERMVYKYNTEKFKVSSSGFNLDRLQIECSIDGGGSWIKYTGDWIYTDPNYAYVDIKYIQPIDNDLVVPQAIIRQTLLLCSEGRPRINMREKIIIKEFNALSLLEDVYNPDIAISNFDGDKVFTRELTAYDGKKAVFFNTNNTVTTSSYTRYEGEQQRLNATVVGTVIYLPDIYNIAYTKDYDKEQTQWSVYTYNRVTGKQLGQVRFTAPASALSFPLNVAIHMPPGVNEVDVRINAHSFYIQAHSGSYSTSLRNTSTAITSSYTETIPYVEGTRMVRFEYRGETMSKIIVEYSTDDGLTWKPYVGINDWIFAEHGTNHIKVRFTHPTGARDERQAMLKNIYVLCAEKPYKMLGVVERIIGFEDRVLSMDEYITVRGRVNLPLLDRVVIDGAKQLPASERILKSNSSSLAMKEQAMLVGSAKLLPMKEDIVYSIKGTKKLSMYETVKGTATKVILSKERVVKPGVSSAYITERVAIQASTFKVARERVLQPNMNNISITEVVRLPFGMSHITLTENIRTYASDSLDLTERILRKRTASLELYERVRAPMSSSLKIHEYIDSDMVEKIRMHEYIKHSGAFTIPMYTYVSDEALDVLVRQSIFSQLKK